MTSYVIDPVHTHLEFCVRHAGIGKSRGRFLRFTGDIEVADPASPAGSSVRATIDPSSVSTSSEARDKHLRSSDFFEVEAFPEWTFASTGVTGTNEAFTLDGELTIHGVTRPVSLDCAFLGEATDPWGAQRAAFEATTSLSRKDYGLTWNVILEAGGVLVSDNVDITLEVEALRAS